MLPSNWLFWFKYPLSKLESENLLHNINQSFANKYFVENPFIVFFKVKFDMSINKLAAAPIYSK